MGAIGNCCCCFSETGLPTISIPGMHEEDYSDWIVTTEDGQCCARQTFVFDDPQDWVGVDGGAVMTYDKTTTIERQFYNVPIECRQVLTGYFTPATSGGDPEIYDIPDEPAYTNCCPTPTIVNTQTQAIRLFGGQRFIMFYRPVRITVTIQQADTECTDRTQTTAKRWIVTSRHQFESCYAYVDYDQATETITNSSTNPCWGGDTENTVGEPFEMPTVPNCQYESEFEFCRRLILDEDDFLAATTFDFAIDTTAENCSLLVGYDCDACTTYATEICYLSDEETASSEPSAGFCTPQDISLYTATATIPKCQQHRYQLIDTSNGDLIACFFWSPSAYDDIVCSVVFTALLFGAGGTVSGYGVSCGFDPILCDPYEIECPGCPPPLIEPIATYPGCRLSAASEYIDCSGYVAQEACAPFVGWTVNVEWPA
jgi:hypothetical protein